MSKVFLFAALVALISTAQAFDCTVTNKYMVTRLWQLKPGATFTTTSVAAEFQSGFAPTVRNLAGFNEYVGAVVNSTHNFFFNVFNTQTDGAAGQTAAANFVNNGVLAAQISRSAFWEGALNFLITSSDTCLAMDTNGMALAVRLWNVVNNITAQGVVDTFRTGFGPIISAQPGFKAYGSFIVNDGSSGYVLFFNIFQSAAQAADANAQAAGFVNNGTLFGKISRNTFLESTISFDVKPSTGNGAGILSVTNSLVLALILLLAVLLR